MKYHKQVELFWLFPVNTGAVVRSIIEYCSTSSAICKCKTAIVNSKWKSCSNYMLLFMLVL